MFNNSREWSHQLCKFSSLWVLISSFLFCPLCVITVTNLRWGGPVMPPPATSPPAVPPPDGGWGWAVVLGSFISIGFSYAFPKAITVFFKEIQIIFDASYSQIAWISSIMLAVMYAAGESICFHLVWKLLLKAFITSANIKYLLPDMTESSAIWTLGFFQSGRVNIYMCVWKGKSSTRIRILAFWIAKYRYQSNLW